MTDPNQVRSNTVCSSSIALSQCRLRLSRPLRKGEATAIRGFFGQQFADQVHMHNHDADGSPIYLYPRVQYKVIDETAFLFGINEGSELLQKLWLDFDQSIPLADHDQSLTVLETQFETSSFEIRHSVNPVPRMTVKNNELKFAIFTTHPKYNIARRCFRPPLEPARRRTIRPPSTKNHSAT